MVTEYTWLAESLPVTPIVKVYAAAAVGVPLISPVLPFRISPVGSEPEFTV